MHGSRNEYNNARCNHNEATHTRSATPDTVSTFHLDIAIFPDFVSLVVEKIGAPKFDMASSSPQNSASAADQETAQRPDSSHAEVVPATPTVALTAADDDPEIPHLTQDSRVDTGESGSGRRTVLLSGWNRLARRPSVAAASVPRPSSILQHEESSPTPSRHGDVPFGGSFEEKTVVETEIATTIGGNQPDEPPTSSQATYKLDIFPEAIRPRTSVDIIAVHDFDETPEDAWVMPVERLLSPGRPDGDRDRTASPGPRDPQRMKVPVDKKGKGPDLMNPSEASQKLDAKLRPPAKDFKSRVRSLEPSMHSSSEFDVRGRSRAVNWIRDFVPNDITDSRVLSFSYSSPTFDKKTGSWAQYVENAAKALLERIASSRQLFFQRGVPVVFIGSGFGGIIVQKAIALAAAQNHAASLAVDDIFQVLLLDTPFPEPDEPQNTTSEDRFKSWFPKNTNVRMSRILLEIETRDKDSELVDDVWKEYQESRKKSTRGLETTWLYSQARVQQGDADNLSLCKDEDEYRASVTGITFTSVAIYRHRRLARMGDSQDYIYRTILAKVQSIVLYQAIKSRNIDLVENILDSKPPLIYKTECGRNPLHVACLMEPPSETIVTLLINERPDDTTEPDDGGATPLHHAVLKAWYNEPEEGRERSEWSGVIRYLMRNMQREDLDLQDNEGHSPWDSICTSPYLCGCTGSDGCAATWIRELRENLEPIRGPAITQDHDLPTEPTPPKPDSSQYIASFVAEGTVSEFYHTTNKKTKRVEEQINLKTTSVYDMVYDANKGCARVLELSRRKGKDKDFRCRWILLPANNEQWLSDLFLSIGVRDASITDQRHDGLTIFNRYMNPRAKTYQFTRFSVDTSEGSELPTNQTSRLQTVVEEPTGYQDRSGGSTSQPQLPPAKRSSKALSSVTWATLPPVNLEHMGGDKTLALFMPYLAYESHDGRKRMAAMINRVNDKSNPWSLFDRDSALIDGYIHAQDVLPLHCRRTLDQYSYYMLETTERRDKDQVVYRWATKHGKPKNTAPILMVDQLWLWVLPDGTVITCMPNTQKPSEPYNIKRILSREIETNKSRQAIQSPDSLVEMILKTCLNIMTRQGPGGVKLQEAFQSSINTIAEDEAVKMKKLLRTVDKLANAKDPFKYTSDIDSFSRISDESRQLVEIIDIQDELGIIKSILTTQLKVLEEFQGLIRPRKRSGGSKEQDDGDGDQHAGANKKSHHGTGLKNARVVDEAVRIVEDNLIRVQEMDESAKRVEAELKQLLQFKQQQASGWDTRYAMKLSEQGSRQNTIMVVFTIVTVIFLPLSFIASFLAIGIAEFPKNEESGEVDWPVKEVSKYLFAISVGVSAAILLCIGIVFYRMASKAKKRMDSAQRPPPSKWQALKQSQIRRRSHKHNHRQDDDSYLSDCTSDISADGYSTRRRQNTDDSSDEESDDMSIDDDNDYAPIFRRFRFHTHVPGLRKLWLWKLYPVSQPPAHHQVSKAQEDFEWDYPLRRWRDVTKERVTLFIASWKSGKNEARTRDLKHNHPDDDECFSEDERHRSQTEELEHRERVEERKNWLKGWLGLSWAKKKGRQAGDEPEHGDEEDAAHNTRNEKGLGRLFRRRGNREERWDEEMGTARPA